MTSNCKERLDTLLDICCEYYNVALDDVNALNRNQENVKTRRAFYYLAFELMPSQFSLWGLSEHYFHQDHSTIMHAIKTTRNYVSYDLILKDDLKIITKIFNDKYFS